MIPNPPPEVGKITPRPESVPHYPAGKAFRPLIAALAPPLHTTFARARHRAGHNFQVRIRSINSVRSIFVVSRHPEHLHQHLDSPAAIPVEPLRRTVAVKPQQA